MPRSDQQEWIENTLQRLHPPGLRDVAVLLLDTGVNREHPLIAPLLHADDLHTYNTEWVTSDEAQMTAKNMSKNIHLAMEEGFKNFTPRPTYDLIKVGRYEQPTINHKITGY